MTDVKIDSATPQTCADEPIGYERSSRAYETAQNYIFALAHFTKFPSAITATILRGSFRIHTNEIIPHPYDRSGLREDLEEVICSTLERTGNARS